MSQNHHLAGLAGRYLRLAIASKLRRDASDADHRALIAHCLARDADRVAVVVETHVGAAWDELWRVLEG